MRASDFHFDLPPEQIAQQPAAERDQARLYVLPRHGGPPAHAQVADLPRLLPEGALLVMNDTRVIPARLRGRKPTGGRFELLLVRPCERVVEATGWRETWACLGAASKPLRPGMTLLLDGERAPAAQVQTTRTARAGQGGEIEVLFAGDEPGGMLAVLERIGEVPLPPYIERPSAPDEGDRERYQTVYARTPGAAAAPTAGLHFTPRLLEALEQRGIARATLTLHVGLGTFAPLRSDEVDAIDALHPEPYDIPVATCEAVAAARAAGRPVVAVGTTSVRTLESASDERGQLRPGPGTTRLFIKPGYRFRVVDGMLTNFHLPRSTLLMLVCALGGQERVLGAYNDAVAHGYRFYSYGDAMLLL
jgi:S-adenosylmethionine:tRNA ribosyltransferase-isomerase